MSIRLEILHSLISLPMSQLILCTMFLRNAMSRPSERAYVIMTVTRGVLCASRASRGKR